VAELPTEAEAPESANKLAIAERIMHEDKAILASLATADDIDVQIGAAREVMARRKNALRELGNK
jgi:hypothetical protein